MPELVDANLEIFKKTAYRALGAMWIGIVISSILPFLLNPSYVTVVLGSIIGGVIIVIASYMLLISVKLKKTKEISVQASAFISESLKKGEENGKK